jgi:hypothetical protein
MSHASRALLTALSVGSLALVTVSLCGDRSFASDEKPAPRSEVLDDGFKELTKGMFDFVQQRGGTIPADAKARTTLAEQMLDGLEKTYPSLRTVTAKEAEDFKQGKFDDKANTARIKELAARLMELPEMAKFVVNSTYEGKLKGKELEAGRRFMEALAKSRETKSGK